jgi:hypothetical protein
MGIGYRHGRNRVCEYANDGPLRNAILHGEILRGGTLLPFFIK